MVCLSVPCCCEEKKRPSLLETMSSFRKKEISTSTSNNSSLHENILRESKEDVFDKYEVTEVIGEGSMGSVAKARIREDKIGGSAFRMKDRGILGLGFFPRKKKTGFQLKEASSGADHEYALKSIILDRVSPVFIMELLNEIDILRGLDHPNIVKLHEVYKYRKQIYLVLEMCDGGDLYEHQPYSEQQAAKITTKLLSAVKYMHDHKVVHRDLKFENVMFETKKGVDGSLPEIKVIDFGLSKKFIGTPGLMRERVGTIYTMAPQVLQGVYSNKADIWAVGVIAYALCSSSKPFYHRRRRKMIDLIMRADYNYDHKVWETISDDAKEFIDSILVIDPQKRPDASQALKKNWITHVSSLNDERPSEDILKGVEDSLLNYRNTSPLKKLALNVIAHRSSTKEIMDLRKVFEQYDTLKNGVITFEEFENALRKAKYPTEAMQDIFESIDVNKQGYIQYTEFIAATIEAHGHIAEDKIAEAFDRIDSDDSGFISRQNLRDFLGKEYSPELVEKIISDADENKDGKISYSEFLALFRKQQNVFAIDAQATSHAFSTTSEDEEDLVGLDAIIPGGKFDSANSESSTM